MRTTNHESSEVMEMPRFLLLPAMAVLLSGCCMFMPCHPGLWVHGTVRHAGSGQPVAGAAVSVFGTTVRTGADGCFKLELADALPFELKVTSPGDKPAVSDPPRGHYRVTVDLVPQDADASSSVQWVEAGVRDFAAAPDCD